MALLAPGTQWSHRPTESLPAACEPRTCGMARNAEAAAVVARKRRRVTLREVMGLSLRIEARMPNIVVMGIVSNLTPDWTNSLAESRQDDGRGSVIGADSGA